MEMYIPRKTCDYCTTLMTMGEEHFLHDQNFNNPSPVGKKLDCNTQSFLTAYLMG